MKTVNEMYKILADNNAKAMDVGSKKNYKMERCLFYRIFPLVESEEEQRAQIKEMIHALTFQENCAKARNKILNRDIPTAFKDLPLDITNLVELFKTDVTPTVLVRVYQLLACLYIDGRYPADIIKDCGMKVIRESDNYAILPVIYGDLVSIIHTIAELTDDPEYEATFSCNYFIQIIRSRYSKFAGDLEIAVTPDMFKRCYRTFLAPYFDKEVIQDLLADIMNDYPYLRNNKSIMKYCKENGLLKEVK